MFTNRLITVSDVNFEKKVYSRIHLTSKSNTKSKRNKHFLFVCLHEWPMI